jgi:glycosyl hydrolase family 20
MKKLKIFFCVAGLVASSISSFAGAVTPVKEKDEIVIFDANKNEVKDIVNYTTKWKAGSDLTSRAELVEKNGQKWVKFSHTGSQGNAISRIDVKNGILGVLRQEGEIYDGVKFKIAYDGKEFEKVQIQAFFNDKTIVVKYIVLEKGIKEYSVKKGFRCAKFPPDWDNLKYVWFSTDKPGITFLLQKVTMLLKKPSQKKLQIIDVKKTKEILPLECELFINGKLNPNALKGAAEVKDFYAYKGEMLKDSPFKAQIGYNNEYLVIKTKADFPKPPQANVKKEDDGVYQDEALEYFFSPWNDNNKKIQFVVNAAGTTFDYLRDYDNVAAKIINITNWDLPHKKTIEYKDSTWTTLAAFPLKELKLDLRKNRFMGFQLTQSYKKDKHGKENCKTLSWSPTQNFPAPQNFGILVFNKKLFGNGSIDITGVQSFVKNEKFIDLTIKFKAKNFSNNKYALTKTVIATDYTVYKQNEDIQLSNDEKEHSVKITSVKNLNGIFSLYLSFKNKNGDIKVAAVNFENATPLKDMFGKNIFSPTPKKVIWSKGFFQTGNHNTIVILEKATKRTEKTAQIFAKDLFGYSDSKYKIEKTNKTIPCSIELKIANKADFQGKSVPLKKEGYSLIVTPEKVIITGADAPGLYYGCVTFIQLLKMPMKFASDAPAQCVQILDWPDIHNRLLRMSHPWHFKDRNFKEVRSVDYLIDWANRFIAGNKLNRWWLDVAALVKLKRRPEFNGTERIYTLDDMRKLADFCRDRFVEIIPAFPVGGHADWWLLQYHPELREKGYKNMSDLSHPKHNKIVFDCMLDVIEAMNAKYASPKTDEYWHGKHPNEIPDKLLRGKTRAQVLLDFHAGMNNFLKKRGVKMLIYEDMLNPRHNGKRDDVYKIIDKFPKDVIITAWSGREPDLTAQYFLDKGFEVWGNTTGFWMYGDKVKNRISGFGPGVYSFGNPWGLTNKRNYAPINGVFRGADYAWNISRDARESIIDEISSGKLVALREMFAVQPNPFASATITPLKIQKLMNAPFAKAIQKDGAEFLNMPSGKCEIGNIPSVISKKKNNCVLLSKGSKVEFPISKKKTLKDTGGIGFMDIRWELIV